MSFNSKHCYSKAEVTRAAGFLGMAYVQALMLRTPYACTDPAVQQPAGVLDRKGWMGHWRRRHAAYA
jgi:hypothetical protein